MTSEAAFEHAARLAGAEVEAGVARVCAAVSRARQRHAVECEDCGQDIDPRRLAAVPEAVCCASCQEDRER